MGNGLPPVHSDKIMEPMIEQCLKLLPPAKAEVKEVKKAKQSFRGSKALSDKDNLNAAFKDEPIEELGKMSE